MTAATRHNTPETYIPRDSEHGQLLDLVAALESRGARVSAQPALVTASGKRLELPAEVADAFEQMVRLLAGGQGVTVVPHHRLLTTQEAADLLNISRPTFIKLLESGELPFELRGRHRRIRLEDVLEYQSTLRRGRAEALNSMQEEGQHDGMYEHLDVPPVRTR